MQPRFFVLLLGIICLALVSLTTLPAAADPNATAALELLGSHLRPDAGFYGNRDWTNTKELPRQDIGGRLQVYIRNTDAASRTVTGFTLGGKTFNQLTSHATSRVDDTKWWRIWPNPIPPGQTAILNLRLIDLATDLPPGAGLTLQTDGGDVDLAGFNPAPADLWISALNFSDDLTRIILFVSNRGQTDITLKASGGLAIDGGSELTTGSVADTTLSPGNVIPVTVSVNPGVLVAGRQTLFQINAASGQTAFGSVRVFPYQFTTMAHMQGANYDEADRAAHFIDNWAWQTPEILDEPHGHSIPPMTVVQRVDDWLNDSPTRAGQNPTTIHNTSYLEGLVYDDIADIANSHWGNTRQDLATYLTAPKANWYMPQNSWGHNEGLYRRESWSGLEDLQFQAFQAAGRGAKAIQWFLFQNHWRQGWGRMEGTDFARIFQDKYRTGHISNPLTWDRIGRVSGALYVIKPYLTHSAHAGDVLTNGIQIDLLISSTENGPRALATVMDYATPRDEHAGYAFRYDVPRHEQQRRYNLPLRLTLPGYLNPNINRAYVIDPWLGVQEMAVQKTLRNHELEVRLTLPELNVGALLVLGNAADGPVLQSRWAEVAAQVAAYDDAKPAALSRARPHPADPWRAPDVSYRQRITVTNQGGAAATTFALPLDLPGERAFPQASYRVFEDDSAVPFAAVGAEIYADFTDPANHSRMKWSGQGGADASWFTVTQTITGVHFLSTKLNDPMYAWGASFWQDQGPLPWMTQHPDYWIPAEYGSLWVDINPTGFPFGYYNYKLVIYWDENEDGIIDKSRGFTFSPEGLPNGEWSDWVRYDLGKGWRRYIFDLDQVFDLFYPGQERRGQYRPGYQTIIPGGYDHLLDPDTRWPWSIRQVMAVGGKSVVVQPPVPLAPGETRTYEIYLDVVENGPDTPSSQLSPGLSAAATNSLSIAAGPLERAGVRLDMTGQTLNLSAQAETDGGVLRHVSGGTITTRPINAFPASLTLSPTLQPGDLLTVIPIQPGSEGESFVFDETGAAVVGQVPAAQVIPAKWQHLLQRAYTGQAAATRTIPYAVDLSPDGKYLALGATIVTYDLDATGDPPVSNEGWVRLFDTAGQIIWEKTFAGRPFHVRFSPDSASLYVAANLGTDGITHSGDWVFRLYEDSHIIKYDLAGTEAWRHKVGAGVADIPTDEQGRTVFDMQVYPNGDVLYAEWHAYGVRLNGNNGQVVWAQDTGFGTNTYTPRVVPLDDGGAVLLGFYSRRVDAAGQVVSSLFMSNENHHALGASADGEVWATAGNTVRVINSPGDFRITPGGPQTYIGPGTAVGRYPRVIRVSNDGAYVATGSSDGVFSLLNRAGEILWQKAEAGAYVTDIHLLPDGAGVAVMWEIFNYRHANRDEVYGWRWRDVVAAYDLAGAPLWRHEGTWREDEPGMGQFVVSAAGNRLAVLSNGDVRYVDLSAAPVPNSTIYHGGSGSTGFLSFATYLPIVLK